MNPLGKLANFPKAEIVLLSAECISGRRSHFNILSSLHSFSPKKFQQNGEEGQRRGFFSFFLNPNTNRGCQKLFYVRLLRYLFFFLFENTFRYRILKIELMIHNKYVHAVYIIA